MGRPSPVPASAPTQPRLALTPAGAPQLADPTPPQPQPNPNPSRNPNPTPTPQWTRWWHLMRTP
jgi:hypothetical protein